MRITMEHTYTCWGITVLFMLEKVVYIHSNNRALNIYAGTMVDEGTRFLTYQFKISDGILLGFLFCVFCLYGFLWKL